MTIVLVLEMHESAVRVLWHPWNQNRRVLSPRFFASKTQKIASGYKKKISILRQNTSEAVFETEKEATSVRVELTILRLTVSRLSQLGHEVIFEDIPHYSDLYSLP